MHKRKESAAIKKIHPRVIAQSIERDGGGVPRKKRLDIYARDPSPSPPLS